MRKEKKVGKLIRKLLKFSLAFFAPSENAMYAGAGQYVAEATELDDTLIGLKDIIDQKIEELGEE